MLRALEDVKICGVSKILDTASRVVSNIFDMMSFREKRAWISFVSLLVVCVFYMWNFARVMAGWARPGVAFRASLWAIIIFVIADVMLHIALRLESPQDSRTPKDEREQLIDMKASQIAFPVLMIGALAAVGMIHVTTKGWVIAHAVLLAVGVAATVRFGGQVLYYRRGV